MSSVYRTSMSVFALPRWTSGRVVFHSAYPVAVGLPHVYGVRRHSKWVVKEGWVCVVATAP